MKKIKGEVWTNSPEWDTDLHFTSDCGRHEGPVTGCPANTAQLGVTASEVYVVKGDGNGYVYHSEKE